MVLRRGLGNEVTIIANNNKILYNSFTGALTGRNYGITILSLGRRTTGGYTSRVVTSNNRTITIGYGILSLGSVRRTESAVGRLLNNAYSVLLGNTNNGGPGNAAAGSALRRVSLIRGSRGVGAFFSLSPSNVDFMFGLGFLNALVPARIFTGSVIRGRGTYVIVMASVGTCEPLAEVPTCSTTGTTIGGFAR